MTAGSDERQEACDIAGFADFLVGVAGIVPMGFYLTPFSLPWQGRGRAARRVMIEQVCRVADVADFLPEFLPILPEALPEFLPETLLAWDMLREWRFYREIALLLHQDR